MKNYTKALVVIAALTGSATGCSRQTTSNQEKPAPAQAESTSSERQIAWNPFGSKEGRLESEKITFLSQNWNQDDREAFYFTPQGSHIIPVRFAKELKAENGRPFFTSEYLTRFGYIPQKAEPKNNPLGLPVGFTIDGYTGYAGITGGTREVGERWVGINCAACHTSNLRFGDKTLRIDGGQSLSDFQRFVNDMDRAVFSTAKNPQRMQEFLRAVADGMNPPAPIAQVEEDFRKFMREREVWQRMNGSTRHFGGGRNDAFAVIFNQVLARDLGIPENAREPDAPVSYPVIWDAPHHDWVQWNGLASNDPEIGGPMARNLGQVLGVFGRVDFSKQTEKLGGFCSSGRRIGLETLEDKVRKLWSPKWPEAILGKLDQRRIASGKAIYQKNCVSCHAVLNREDPKRSIPAVLVDMKKVGTDPQMNLSAGLRMALTGPLIGRKTRLQHGRPLEREEPAAFVLKHAVASALAGTISPRTCEDSIETGNLTLISRWSNVVKKAIQNTPMPAGDEKLTRPERQAALLATLGRYKARPLNGVWSSAPFLHNGSVRTLYQLLLPPAEREASFFVGCENFDPSEVGYKCEDESETGVSRFNTALEANLNSGHEYGTDLSNEDRLNLIEYIKSL
jgi:mono/diheme cytochrome c family protein